jgi:branched-chain amino acid transport system permease protein
VFEAIISQGANGLVLGGLYVVIAVGLSITFGALGIVNFAHGAFFALGAYAALQLVNAWGWPAVLLAPIVVGLVGMLLEVLVIRRLYGKDPIVSLVVTFSLSLLVEALIRLLFGADGYSFNAPPWLSGVVELGPILMTRYRAAVLVAAVFILLALHLFLTRTPFGRILRAGSRDPEMVEVLGIRLTRVRTAVFGLGCALAALAGLFAAPLWTVTPSMGLDAIMPAFVVVAIGGLGSFAGAVIAGLLVGLVTSITIQFKPEAATASMYLLMFIIMLMRPRGLLGERWERFE